MFQQISLLLLMLRLLLLLPSLLPSLTFMVGHRYVTKQGFNPQPPFKSNQDSFLTTALLGGHPDMHLFGVFDGHGPDGDFASVRLP